MVYISLLNQISHPNQVPEPILQLLMLHIQSCSLCLDALEVSSPSLIAVEILYQDKLSHAVRMFKECNVKVPVQCYHNTITTIIHKHKHLLLAASTVQDCICIFTKANESH